MAFERMLQRCDSVWSAEHEKEVLNMLLPNSGSRDAKSSTFYHYRRNFLVVSFAGVNKVARRKDKKIMATKEMVFSLMSNLHIACGHGGERKTYKKINEIYSNVPRSLVAAFLSECERCAEKRKKPSMIGLGVRPITVPELSQRGQVDLVDFQSSPDGEYKFILEYQDHLTKFRFLVALKSETAPEVARALLNIFSIVEAPHVLQSNKGREFTDQIIQSLKEQWPELLLLNGKPLSSQAQVERSNSVVKDSIETWLRDNGTSSWATGLLSVQRSLNTSYDETIRMQPHEALFGRKARAGLNSVIPAALVPKIMCGTYEEDILALLEGTLADPAPMDIETSPEGDDSNQSTECLGIDEPSEVQYFGDELSKVAEGKHFEAALNIST